MSTFRGVDRVKKENLTHRFDVSLEQSRSNFKLRFSLVKRGGGDDSGTGSVMVDNGLDNVFGGLN